MRTLSRHLAGILVALSVLAGAAWADSTGTISGDPVVPRQGTDLFSNFYLLDTNQPFGVDGTVDRWEIYTLNTLNVALVIYRETGGVFVEVGRSEVVTPSIGYNLFSLKGKNKIKVKAGDFVGAYFPGQGSISYTPDTSSPFETDLQATVLSTDSNAPNSTDFQISSYRDYSLRAFGSHDKDRH